MFALIRRFSDYKKEYGQRKNQNDYDSDSDGEHETKSNTASKFWRRKMRTLHGRLDLNNDGVISYDDCMMLVKSFTALGNLKSDAAMEFKNEILRSWEEQWGEVSPYNHVNVEQYLTRMNHMLNDREQRKKVHRFLPFLFEAVDKDHSGFITLTEFKLFFKCLQLTEEDAAVTFAVIDTNGDGKLSIKEFVKLGRDFFLTQNESNISRMFWGPLIHEH